MKTKLLSILTLLLCAVTGAWATDWTIAASNFTLNEGVYTYTFSEVKLNTYKTGLIYVEVPSAEITGTVSWQASGTSAARKLYIYKTNGTVKDTSREMTFTSGWQGVNYTSSDILANGGKYYLVFNTQDDWKATGVKYTAVAETPSTTTTVHSAEEGTIAYLDNSGAISGSKTEPYAAYKLTYSSSPFAIVCSAAEASENIQVGNDQYQFAIGGNNYTGAKFTKGKTFVVEPNTGITITAVSAYASSNSSSTSTISTADATSLGVAARGEKNAPASPTAFTLTKNGSGKYEFSIGGDAGQALVVLKVTYNKVENVDVKVSSAGYATLYYNKKLAIPAGVTAYKAAVKDASTITITPLEGTVIPANTGVILKANAGTYNFLVTDAGATAVEGNILTGATTTTAVSANSVYTLGQNGSGVVGLRQYSGTSIRAYSAYATSIAGARAFYNFSEDETTGIDATLVNSEKSIVNSAFDLQGRKVAQPKKGLYIVNGKKVVIR